MACAPTTEFSAQAIPDHTLHGLLKHASQPRYTLERCAQSSRLEAYFAALAWQHLNRDKLYPGFMEELFAQRCARVPALAALSQLSHITCE